jgi:predicted small lipoprotein YifL
MKRHVLMFSLLAVLVLTLSGCGLSGLFYGNRDAFTTEVNGASVKVDNTIERKGRGEQNVKTSKVVITPGVAPVTAPAVTVTAGTQPATQPGSVRITQGAVAPPATILLNGHAITAPAGSAITLELSETASVDADTYKHARSGYAAGPTLRSNAKDGGTNSFKFEAPTLNMGEGEDGGMTADGGDSRGSFVGLAKVLSSLSTLAKTLGLVGVVLLVAAVVWAWVTKAPFNIGSLILAGGGVVLLALAVVVDKYPWVLLIGLLLLPLLGLVWWLYHRQTQALDKTSKTLSVVTGAVEAAPDAAAAQVKATVAQAAALWPWLKDEIGKAKAAMVMPTKPAPVPATSGLNAVSGAPQTNVGTVSVNPAAVASVDAALSVDAGK